MTTPINDEERYDPEHIVARLPARERELFLRDYRAAVAAAYELSGYPKLRALLRTWSQIADATAPRR